MLENNVDICIHHRNIQALLTEVFKIKSKFTTPIIELTLNKRFNTYNLRNFQEFATERKRTVWYDVETLSYRYLQLFMVIYTQLPFFKPIQKKY